MILLKIAFSVILQYIDISDNEIHPGLFLWSLIQDVHLQRKDVFGSVGLFV